MTYDQAQSPRLGQRVPPENPGVRIVTSVDLPEVAYRGQIIWLTDLENLLIYDGTAWQEPNAALAAGNKIYVQSDAPTDASLNDLWLDVGDGNAPYYWDGTTWQDARDQLLSDVVTTTDAHAILITQAQADADQALLDAADAATAAALADVKADAAQDGVDFLDAKFPITGVDIADDAISAPKILANTISASKMAVDYVYAGSIEAAQISSGYLEAELEVVSRLVARSTSGGGRVDIDQAGINFYDTDGTVTISLPTDDTRVARFEGSGSFNGLTVLNGFELRGQDNIITRGSYLTLQTQTSGAAAGPVLIQDYPTETVTGLANIYAATTGYTESGYTGRKYGAHRFFDSGSLSINWTYYLFPQTDIGDGTTKAEFNPTGGVCVVWDSVLGKELLVTYGYKYDGTNQIRVYDPLDIIGQSDMSTVTPKSTTTAPTQENVYNSPQVKASMAGEGEFVYSELRYDRTMKCRRYAVANGAITLGSTTTFTAQTPITEYTVAAGATYGSLKQLGVHATDDTTMAWLVNTNYGAVADYPNSTIYCFNSGGTGLLSNYHYNLNGRAGWTLLKDNVGAYEGQISWIWGNSNLTRYTDVIWGSETDRWWIGYTWTGSGGPYESNVSARTSITAVKHGRVRVTVPAPPGDDPDVDGANIYVGRDEAADPGVTAVYLYSSESASSTNLVYNGDFELALAGDWQAVTNSGTLDRYSDISDGWVARISHSSVDNTSQLPFTIPADVSNSTSGTWSGSDAIQQTAAYRFGVEAGKSYQASAAVWSSTDSGKTVTIYIDWYNSSSALVSSSSDTFTSGTTRAASIGSAAGVAPSTAVSAAVRIAIASTTVDNYHYIDDISCVSMSARTYEITTTPAFTGTTPPSSSNFPSDGTAYLQSASINPVTELPMVMITGDGDAHFENLDVSGGGVVYMEKLHLDSVTDVNTSSGNLPPLRVGDIEGLHLRIDGNEIQCMSSDTATGTLILNQGGGEVRAAGGGGFLVNNGPLQVDNQLYANGSVNEFPNAPTTTNSANANLNTGSNNRLRLVSSLSKYKVDQEQIPLDVAQGLLAVPAKTWYDKTDLEEADGDKTKLRRVPGFVAEDMEQHAPLFALYANGELQGVDYDRVPAGLLVLIRDLYDRMAVLEGFA